MAEQLHRNVYALDLPNHGASPWTTELSYETMSASVTDFIRSEISQKSIVIGHSMGAKVAMTMALNKKSADMMKGLCVVDMAPRNAPLSDSFQAYIDAMLHIESLNLQKKSEADTILAKTEPDLSIRQFLLTNFVHVEDLPEDRRDSKKKFAFRVNLNLIKAALPKLSEFPPLESNEYLKSNDLEAVVIHGTKSGYFNEARDLKIFKQLFPNEQLRGIHAGHWVHAEKPREFINAVAEFIIRIPK